MKKICFFIGNLSNAGGTEKVTTLIANSLSEKKYDISILSLVDGKVPFFELNKNIKIYSLYTQKVSFKKNYLGVVYRLRNFIKSQGFDALVVVDSISCIFTIPALWGLSVKHICWEHFNFLNNNGTRLRDLGRMWAAKSCDIVVTLTEKDKELWLTNIKNVKAKIIAVPNPIVQLNNNKQPNLDSKIVLSVGRLVDVKGFDLLLKAWKTINEIEPEWKLYIVGDGEERKDLEDLAAKLKILNSIQFLGRQSNVSQFYENCSFYCLSSRFEGFPMVLLEAQTFGLPIVSFDCDTGPAEIIVEGESGFLAKSGDVQDLTIKMLKMMDSSEDEYMMMSKSAYQNSKQYSINKIVTYWVEIVR